MLASELQNLFILILNMMDVLYYLGYYLALFLIPFVVYFLLFKKNEGRSIYSNRDWFYCIKFHYAKNAVKRYQEKYRSYALAENLDTRISTPSEKFSTTHYFYGLDQTDNNLSLKFTLRHGKIAEVSLILRLADGNTYVFPGGKGTLQTKIPKEQWKINGLSIEVLEPLKRLRVTFNGLLKNVAVKDYEKVEHVQFNLVFNASGSPTHIPHGMDTNLLAETLAKENWRDGSWIDYLVDQSGYEQFGAMQGFVKGDSYPKEYSLNLPTCRSKYEGICDRYLVNMELRLFLADVYGNLINIVIKSFKNGCSQLNYGSVILSTSEILPIKGVDIPLNFVGKYKNIPEVIITHIEVKLKSFKCVVHLNKTRTLVSTNDEEAGYEYYNIPAECNVNSNQARAVVEFWYSKQGTGKFVPNILLCERTVNVLPDVLVSNIKSEDSKILELTGGKGNSLALLSSLNSKNFTVPDGFIITVNAFKRQLQSSPLLITFISHIDDICCGRRDGKLEDVCSETVSCFKKEKILPEIVEAILTELYSIKKNEDETVGWAVRSSAVGEDSEELSAAGQNETFLGCLTQEQILKSVTACWASLFTYQSVQYRWQHGLPILSDMAVIIQKMVPAESAGVLFTCHPSTSNPSQMVVTSNYGLGESVVSGKTDPDTFILNRTWDDKVCFLDYNIGIKHKIVKMTDRGIEEIDRKGGFEFVDNKNWSITQDQVVSLGKVGVLLEKAFGGPRDIEWAFYKKKLYLLQSRPITTLNSWSDFELTHELDCPILTDHVVLTVANIGEILPNALSVLSQTSTLSIMEKAAQVLASGSFDPAATICVKCIQHTGMIDVINWIHQNVNEGVKISSNILDLAIFGHPVLDDKLNQIAIGIRGISSMSNMIKRNFPLMNDARRINSIHRKMKKAVFDIGIKVDDSSVSVYKKIQDFSNKLIEIAAAHARTTSVSVFYQVVAMNVLLEGGNELRTEHYADFALMLSSCEDVISVEVPKTLEKIAKIIRSEGYNEEFCTIKPQFGVTWLQNKCPEAHKLFREFIEKHGHRNLGEFEVMEESWAENPSKVISMIQANASYDRTNVKNTKSVDEIIKGLVSPKSSVTRSIIKFLIKRIQSSVAIRESTKSTLVQAYNTLRLGFRRLAKKMVAEGVLPSSDLIYHLTFYEIGQVIQRSNPLLITKAIRRQRLYPKWRSQKFPEIMIGIPIPENDEEIHPLEGPLEKICFGTPACTGSVKARACVIKSLDNIDQLQIGDILITHSTDIGWSPYFPMLSGIVTELGGLISHGAVVAREYGLPCLVGVKNATKVFRTGDIVLLSGNTGQLGKAE